MIVGQRDILLKLVTALNSQKVTYLLTGSYAASFYGYPRSTHDVDFMIEVTKEENPKILRVISELKKDFIFSPSEVIKKLQEPSQFNLMHEDTGIKVDFWIITGKEFQQQFLRKKDVKIETQTIPLVSPENLILKKLSWCKEVFSERHFRDCIGILKVQSGKLDETYLKEQSRKLGVEELLKDARTSSY